MSLLEMEKEKRYDLVVAADGQSSRTRRLAFGREVSEAAFKTLSIHGAYFSLPRIDSEGTLAKGHLAPESRMIMTRSGDRPVTDVFLFTMTESQKLRASYKDSLEEQKKVFMEVFRRYRLAVRALSLRYQHLTGLLRA